MPRDNQIAADKDLRAYERLADAAKGLADPVRLEIIDALAQGARTVESLAGVCGLPVGNVSHHLQRLWITGIVDRVRLGRRTVYSLADETVSAFWVSFRAFADGLRGRGEGDRRDRTEEAVSADDLARLLAEGRVTVIDVRPREEYRSGHLPGACSAPLDTVEQCLSDLPRNRPVVAFCRGPYCRLADRAVKLLRESGYEALRCADGVVEWRAAGLALARGEREETDPAHQAGPGPTDVEPG